VADTAGGVKSTAAKTGLSKTPGTFLWIWAEGVEGLSTEWLLGVEKGWEMPRICTWRKWPN
jgi:hypothetical protein